MTRRALLAALLAALPAGAPLAAQAPREPLVDALTQPGVSLELARHRSATLAGVRYELELDLTGDDRAPGRVVVRVERAPDAGDLVLDFRGPELGRVVANGEPVEDAEWVNGHLRIPARHLRPGENTLSATFAAAIAPAGAGVIRFDDPADGARYLYTLLVPADASQLFPAFDQPDLKARFRITLMAPLDWEVVSNAPGTVVRQNGTALWSFAETEPISTYLAAFAAGPWRTWRSEEDGFPVTLYARASRAGEVEAAELIDLNRRSVRWLERYFGVPYPFAKLDLVIAPAFPFGGMEHVGAIFYNENQFVFREPPTLGQRISRAQTIYHEVAHQWFGDLVTMAWFDDLWLKEGFATYVAARMQAELDPASEAWKTFHLRNKPLAYGVDATSGTTPVWQALPNLDLAKSNYGPIVYNKAPAILKQLDFLVGEEAFRAGVTLFLRRHAFGTATWRDLLAAVEEASGVPLADFGAQYVLRAGMPVVETELELRGGRVASLALRQRPAREMEGDPGGWWPGRVLVRLAYRGREDVVLPVAFAGERTVVPGAAGLPAPDYVWANEGDHGYGLFLLDPRSAAHLLRHAAAEPDGLRRAMLWGALWDEVREGRLDPAAYLRAVLDALPAEADEQIAAPNLARGWTALSAYLPPERAAPLLGEWEALLAARADDPALPYGPRKAALDMLVATATTAEGRALLRAYLAEARPFDGESVKQPTRWSIVERLAALGEGDARALIDAEAARDSTPDRARRLFLAGAALPDAALKARYFERFLDDPGLNEDWVTGSLGNFNAPPQAALVLPHLRPALDRLEWIRDNRRIFFLPRWLASFIGSHHTPEALEVVDRFLADRPDLPPDLRRKVLQQRDELERTVRIRGR